MPKRMPPEVLEYLRKLGKAYGSQGREKHDGCGKIGAGEEGSHGGSEETDGKASRGRGHQTREEGGEAELIRATGIVRRGATRGAGATLWRERTCGFFLIQPNFVWKREINNAV